MNLKELRNKQNLSQSQIATDLGISLRAYQNYEYGQREPNIDMLNKLADYFNVTVDRLLGRDTGEPEPIDQLEQQFNMTALEKKILDNYLSLPEGMRSDLMEFLRKSVEEIQSNENN